VTDICGKISLTVLEGGHLKLLKVFLEIKAWFSVGLLLPQLIWKWVL